MQHIDRAGPPGKVDHTIGPSIVRNPNFFDTLPNSRHWLEVVRLLSTLHSLQLITRIVPRILGKVTKTLQGIAEETDGPHSISISKAVYEYGKVPACRLPQGSLGPFVNSGRPCASGYQCPFKHNLNFFPQ